MGSFFYSYRTVDGYQLPLVLLIGRRGLGKTFTPVLRCLDEFIKRGDQFVYVVDTDESMQELCKNAGDKFFRNILAYLRESKKKKDRRLQAALLGSNSGETELTEGDVLNKLKGGTIVVSGRTAGYILSLNSFAKIKRNNFKGVRTIIIDEFIPEIMDARTMATPRRIVSIVQSVARLDDVKIYMLGNAVWVNDNVLVRLGLNNMKKGELRVIKDDHGAFGIAHFIDEKDYPEFEAAANKSVAGRLAAMLGEDNLDKNEFRNPCPPDLLIGERPSASHFEYCIHGAAGLSVRIEATQDRAFYYAKEDSGYRNKTKRYCIDEKNITETVHYLPRLRDSLLALLERGRVRFDLSSTYITMRLILGLEVN